MLVYYFNPGHETAVLNESPFYMPPANIALMQKELSYLPAWYAATDSFVLVDENFDNHFLDTLSLLNFNIKPIRNTEIQHWGRSKIILWGISRQAIHYFNELTKDFETDIAIPQWNDNFRQLNSRITAKDCLKNIIDVIPQISHSIIPTFHSSISEIEEMVANSSTHLLCKAPYSSSGRGLLWLPIETLTQTEKQILSGILKKQGTVSVERRLDKETDFAMEFMTDGTGGIEFVGYSLFRTTEKGIYTGNYLNTQEAIEKILAEKIDLSLLNKVKNQLSAILSAKYASVYEGCIGVDMLIYKEEDIYKLHPCLEINMRYNMGYLACQFCENYLAKTSTGSFHIDFSAKENDTYSKHVQMQEKFPAEFAEGKLTKGYLTLCPVHKHSKYRAYVLVDKST